MRTKILYRLAAGTCSVCLCYGLAVQTLNGDLAAEALTPELSAWEEILDPDAAEPSAGAAPERESISAEQPVSLPSEGRGKRRGMHGGGNRGQPTEAFVSDTPAENTEEEKQRVPEDTGDSENPSGQQTSSAGDPPTLSQFLSALRCGGCRHNCCLLSPQCMKGRSKQQSATVQYTQTYGG